MTFQKKKIYFFIKKVIALEFQFKPSLSGDVDL